jgi:Peptidase family C25/Propeptide_C25/MAM domain, meprin/A5/mu/GEVED domain/Peptidase family C25, C terminal ig-like domain
MKKLFIVYCIIFFSFMLFAINENVSYSDSWSKQGFSVEEQNSNSLRLNYSITEFQFNEIKLDNEMLTNISLPGVFLPNDEGMPNLPGNGKYIAIPQGSKAELRIVNYRVEKITNIDIAPAPRIPLDTEDGPLIYNKNRDAYNLNVNYPEKFVQLSEPSKLRGVDVVMLGVTPFQYNPITKELLVYRDLEIEVNFTGGNGHFGEDRVRNRWWDPIIKDAILNSSILPEIDYNVRSNSRDGAEYLIICPDDNDFITWAETIKDFRQQQGISTLIVTTTDIGGNTVSAIETYVDNAYNSWSTPPAAVLLLADYSVSGSLTGLTSQIYTHPASYPDFVSDNKFADVDEDNLPDIVFARITANDAPQLEVMITKFLDYEQNPPTNPDFYDHPITALGWQTERWFQICSEVVGGYFKEVLSKNPVRVNKVYSGTPGSEWSTATNTANVVNYFGPTGLDYIPASPATLGNWDGGTAQDVADAINAGSFLLQHRDHGSYSGWGEPAFQSSSIDLLTNTGTELPYIFSINCQTGAFHRSTECFTEKFHRYTYNGQNSGALGVLAATEVSYSFVNDTFVWGVMDNMFPDFMPAETAEIPNNFVMPAFGNAAGKHFLYSSGWPYNTTDKLITYRLFHHHGDAFLNLYSEVPQNLTVNHATTLQASLTSFSITADDGSLIALTVNNEIIATADGTGSAVSITIPGQTSGDVIRVTITKQNYFRYEADVDVIVASGPYVAYSSHTINDVQGNNNGSADFDEDILLNMILENSGQDPANTVNAILSTTDSYITILDNAQTFGTIAAGGTASVNDAFFFTIADNIPDQHNVNFDLQITGTADETWNSSFSITVSAPALSVGNLTIDDSFGGNGNGELDPGEIVDIIISSSNVGNINSPYSIGSLSSTSGDVTINNSTHSTGIITTGGSANSVFNITISPTAPIGTIVDLDFSISAGNYSAVEAFSKSIGLTQEDFESGDFISFDWPWTFDGEADWTIVDVDPYEGIYSAKSGIITDSQTSELILTADVTTDGTISFYRKVSSESGYDFLKFYIDGVLQEEWSGDVAWEEVSYSVTAGNEKIFFWQYSRDGSLSSGSDCAWIDYINFPTLAEPQPEFSYTPSSLNFGIAATGTSSTKQFTISNAGGIELSGTITTPDGYYVASADNDRLESKIRNRDNNSDNTISYIIVGTTEQIFDLIFSPTASQTYSGNVVITSNDPDHPSTNLTVTGSGGQPAIISITPQNLNFGSIAYGTNSTLQFAIENTGDADLTGSITTPADFSVSEAIPVDFSASKRTNSKTRESISDNTLNITIIGGSSQIYDVTFSPSVISTYSDNITISHNATDGTDLLPVAGSSYSNISFPYSVNFENSGLLPASWKNAVDDDFDWSLLTGATGSLSTGPSSDHTTGSGYYIYTETSDPNFPNRQADLLTPFFDLDQLTIPEAKYWYHMYGADMGEFHLDLFNGTVWTEDIIPMISGDQGDQWLQQTIDLSGYSGNIQFRFRSISGNSFTSDMAIDDFRIGDALYPDISIDPSSMNEELNVHTNPTSTQDLVIDNSGNAQLTYNVSINYAVNSYCSSSYSNSGSIADDWIANVEYADISNSSTQEDPNSYGDFTAISTEVIPGQSYDLCVTLGFEISFFTQHVRAWFDWNQNGDLDDADESYYLGTAPDDGIYEICSSILVPANALPGNIRMRIIEQYNADPENNPCDPHTETFGETEDYTVIVGAPIMNSWLSLDGGNTTSGSIDQGSSENTIVVGFDCDNLTAGSYTADVIVDSNDPDEPSITIPITLVVDDSAPIFGVSPTSLDYGNVIINNSSTQQFTISNSGNITLSGSITTPNGFEVTESIEIVRSDYSLSSKTQKLDLDNILNYDILGGETITYDLTFNPVVEQNYDGSVTITCNDLNNPTNIITVTAEGIYPPSISVNPNGFDFNLYVEQTDNGSIQIINSGDGPLEFTCNVSYATDSSDNIISFADVNMPDQDSPDTFSEIDNASAGKVKQDFDISTDSDWITFVSNQSSTIPANSNVNATFSVSSYELVEGIYNASIIISSNDPENAEINLPVSLDISNLVCPTNVRIISSDSNRMLLWDSIPGVARYRIYSSSTPDGTFNLMGISLTNQLDITPVSADKMFFRVTSESDYPTDNKTDIGNQNE